MNEIVKPTRTEGTTQKYLARAQQLLMTIPTSYLSNPEIGLHPLEIAKWLHDTAPGLRKSTFRLYKAALGCYMEHMAKQYPEAAADYAAGHAELQKLSSKLAAPRKSLPDRTSSGKVKYVHLDDLMALCLNMVTSNSEWRRRACLWLASGIISGLRPIEWKNTEILEKTSDGGLTLKVANAKNTNGRANGEYREISIPPGWMAEYVTKHLQELQTWLSHGFDYEDYYATSRNELRRAVLELWPNNKNRHYSLYSGRHQFCANLKREGKTKREVADQMGHASEETASEHYGKRRSGHSGLAIKMKMPSVISTPDMGGGSPGA